jgi:Domain of unknown function (DUF4157)
MTYRLTYRQMSPGHLHQFLIQQPVAAHILRRQSLLRYLDLSPLGPQTTEPSHGVWNRFMAQSVVTGRVQPVLLPDTNVPSRSRSGQHSGPASPEQVVAESGITASPDEVSAWGRDPVEEEVGAPALEVAGDPEPATEEPNTVNQGEEAAVISGHPTPLPGDGASERGSTPGRADVPLRPLAARTGEIAHRKFASPEHVIHAARSTEVDHVDSAPLDHVEATGDSASALEVPDDLPTGFDLGNASLETGAQPTDREMVAGVPEEASSGSMVDGPVTASPALELPREAADVPAIPVKPGDDRESASPDWGVSLESGEGDVPPDTIRGEVLERPPSEAPLGKQEEFVREEGMPSQPLANKVEFAPAELPRMAEPLAPEHGEMESDDRPAPSASDHEIAHPEAEASVLGTAPPRAYDIQPPDRPAATQTSEVSTTQVASSAEPSTRRLEEERHRPGTLNPVIDLAPDRTHATVGKTDDSISETSEVERLFDTRTVDREGDQTVDRRSHGVQEVRTVLSPVTSQQPVEIRVARRVGRPHGNDSKDTGLMQPEAPGSGAETPAARRDMDEDTRSTEMTVEGNVAPDDRPPDEGSLTARGPVDAAMDELFAARGKDRSPQAWLARLQQAALDEEHAASGPLPIRSGIPIPSAAPRGDTPIRSELLPERPASTPPTPLPDSTRRFLRPLIGMDPSRVHVHRDERAAEITRVVKADALAVGDTVILNPERSLETPESIGLLAHEFTHIARRRAPRFIPPIVRGRTDIRQSGGAATLSEDEVLARQVEAAVTTAARAVNSPATGPNRPYLPGVPDAKSAEVAAIGSMGGSGHALLPARDPWNGLPAPWESFPAHLEAPAPTGAIPIEAPVVASSDSVGTPAAAPQVLPAAQGRELPEESQGPPVASGVHQGAPVEPDLDLLARQVYSILKRRLDVERRRTG